MSDTVNYLLSPFKGNTNTGYPQGLKLYLWATKEIDKEAEKLDISVSNAKYIIDHFPSLAKKYGWGSLAFMVYTGAGAMNIFRQVYQIQFADMHHQAHGYFGLIGIGKFWESCPSKPFVSISSTKLSQQCTGII